MVKNISLRILVTSLSIEFQHNTAFFFFFLAWKTVFVSQKNSSCSFFVLRKIKSEDEIHLVRMGIREDSVLKDAY